MKALLFISILTQILYITAFGAEIEIRGVYGSPGSFWDKGHSLRDCGVNAVFVHLGAINEELMRRAREEDVRVFAEFPTLNGKGYVEKHPEAMPINEMGEPAPPASWFMGACPTEPGFREYRMEQLRTLLRTHDVDGVWMDYLHWHAQFEEPEPILPETCFNESCLRSFQKVTGISVPGETIAEKARWILENREMEWRNWRCSVIVEWIRNIRNIIEEESPGILLGNYQCPWTDEEFSGARRRILGLDLEMIRRVVDVFSPMVYHERMGRDSEWVGKYLKWFCERTGTGQEQFPKVWSIVQAHNDPGEISPDEFEQVLRLGVAGGSTGVMMFTIGSVEQDIRKIEVMKRVYKEWKNE